MGLNTVRPNHAPGAKYFISTGKDVPYCSECPPVLQVSLPVHAGTTGIDGADKRALAVKRARDVRLFSSTFFVLLARTENKK